MPLWSVDEATDSRKNPKCFRGYLVRGLAILSLATLASGCVTPISASDWMGSHGKGFEAALDAAESANAAYNMVADMPIKTLQSDDNAREKIASLITASRDAYRRARSYSLENACVRDSDLPKIIGAKPVYDGDAISFQPSGRQVSVLVTEKVLMKGDDSTGNVREAIYFVSSRGKWIFMLPFCDNPWQETIGGKAQRPKDSQYDLSAGMNDFGDGFGKLLVGDDVNVDDVIVDIKR